MRTFAFISVLLLTCSCLFAQLPELQKADSVAGLYPGHSLDDLGQLCYKLTGSLTTDTEKFRAIYKWICTNVQADEGMVDIVKLKRRKLTPEKLLEWNNQFSKKMITQLLRKRVTICTGYSWLLREMCLRAGIECVMIDGKSITKHPLTGEVRLSDHSWNAVKLNEQWYLCDPTWSSGMISKETRMFVWKYNDTYFLQEPHQFFEKHRPLDAKWALLQQ